MASLRLTSTRTAELTPLGTPGQRTFEVIRREAAALGPDYEALFAEPFLSPEGDITDWYASVPGQARKLQDAPEEARIAGQERLDGLISALSERAEALRLERDQEKRGIGEALQNALEIPDEGSVYLVGDQPVIVAWAHRQNTARPLTGLLTKRIAAPARAAPAVAESAAPADEAVAAVETQRGGFGWLWWLLWALVGLSAASLAWLLIPACGASGVSWLDWCPKPVVEAPESRRGDELRAELARLERNLRDADQQCRPERQTLYCPETPPSELAVLLDSSSSMDFSINTPPEIEDEIQSLSLKIGPGQPIPADVEKRWRELAAAAQNTPGQSRLEFARDALKGLLKKNGLPPVSLANFDECKIPPAPESLSGDASLKWLDRVRTGSNTALALAIEAAAKSIKGGTGPDDPSRLLLVSDGYDSCGGDPCAAAKAAKAARPGLSIDVIDLAGNERLRCVAEATGGRYTGREEAADPALLSEAISAADRPFLPENCPGAEKAALSPLPGATRLANLMISLPRKGTPTQCAAL